MQSLLPPLRGSWREAAVGKPWRKHQPGSHRAVPHADGASEEDESASLSECSSSQGGEMDSDPEDGADSEGGGRSRAGSGSDESFTVHAAGEDEGTAMLTATALSGHCSVVALAITAAGVTSHAL
jgi:hypothetical protein